ncbi:hypothetical protein BDP27DRAFT_1422726 [Rhodocollybia butyracea]|uniref:Uncharacterized protein n=1 Tax=Rhodocollybia butyracea TaxID=206335 RepID=A0A9P5PPE6_9AGAR|nr:hypothetical protein BDP27DRAFT_1422726 [Rhodocollybia butyracea]
MSEVRITLEAWDEKWIYIVFRCVFKEKPNKQQNQISGEKDIDTSSASTSFFQAPIHSSGVSISNTPARPTDMAKLTAVLLASEELDGSTLHTVISQMCFKVGRITVPPAVVFAAHAHGLGAPPASSMPTPGPILLRTG